MEVVRWQRRFKTYCQGSEDQPGCAEERRALGLLPRDCATCDFPGIMLANLPAWAVIQTTGPAFFDGLGGVNLANARLVCEALGHPWDKAMIRRITAAAGAMLEKDEAAPGAEED